MNGKASLVDCQIQGLKLDELELASLRGEVQASRPSSLMAIHDPQSLRVLALSSLGKEPERVGCEPPLGPRGEAGPWASLCAGATIQRAAGREPEHSRPLGA